MIFNHLSIFWQDCFPNLGGPEFCPLESSQGRLQFWDSRKSPAMQGATIAPLIDDFNMFNSWIVDRGVSPISNINGFSP